MSMICVIARFTSVGSASSWILCCFMTQYCNENIARWKDNLCHNYDYYLLFYSCRHIFSLFALQTGILVEVVEVYAASPAPLLSNMVVDCSPTDNIVSITLPLCNTSPCSFWAQEINSLKNKPRLADIKSQIFYLLTASDGCLGVAWVLCEPCVVFAWPCIMMAIPSWLRRRRSHVTVCSRKDK